MSLGSATKAPTCSYSCTVITSGPVNWETLGQQQYIFPTWYHASYIYIYIESCGWPRPIYGNGFWFSISKLTRRCAIRLLDGGCRLAKCGKGHTTMIKNLIREDVNDRDLDGQRHCWLNYALDSSTSSLQSSLTRKLQAVVMNAIEISLDFLATQRMSVSLGELARVYFMLWSWSGWIIILSCW